MVKKKKKNLLANAGDIRMWVQSLSQEDPLEECTADPLWYSCLENPMDRGAWQVTSMGLQKVGPD